VQRIPLVLETPSFELPETVWKTEIRVLNRLSGFEFEEEKEGLAEGALQEMVKDVRSTVQDAEKASGKKGKETTTRVKGSAKKGKATKKQADVDDEDEASQA
jgi:AP endonuclease 1